MVDHAEPRPGAATADRARDERLRERVLDSEVLRKSRVLEFRVDTVEAPDGHRSTRDIAGHPGGVGMVAIDPDGNVLLVRQWRHAVGGALLEIPAGTLDRDEDGTIEGHLGAARRELEEETGYRADSWRYLVGFYTAPGFTSELMHLYLAEELSAAHEGRLGPDEDERLELERMPLRRAVELAEQGGFADAKSIVGLLLVGRLLGGQLTG
jgi:ADP-ribose diphosphatase